MSAYTDADVQAGADAIWHTHSEAEEADVRLILDAVAPAIAARAKAEVAQDPNAVTISIPRNLASPTYLSGLRVLLDATRWSWLADEIEHATP